GLIRPVRRGLASRIGRLGPHGALVDPRAKYADLLVRKALAFGRHEHALFEIGNVADEHTRGAVAWYDRTTDTAALERTCALIEAIVALLGLRIVARVARC